MSDFIFYEPFANFDRLFEHALRPYINNKALRQSEHDRDDKSIRSFKPRMDLHEDAERNLVTATFEFPGVQKEDVQLSVHDGLLNVSAEKKSSAEHEESGYAVRERRYGKSSRTLRLPPGIKDADIKAAMADGVLTITFPKSSPEQEPKRITIA
ncbi:hypothetical protein D9756_008156 [Leucocoprinus leucothites]|uniref:SHSP domain-containing protein n=1 Tax=Leucocoprinus leucothites TaxID=201217 RepID=A0A8H5FVW1_9AGAR|nr:hypothetical protein D9756_008156 [Leucoagaricus leucothites]